VSAPGAASAAAATALFSATVFVSAALLFLVEPMFAKMVLPLLGGTPAVWTTCVVFFQAVMLLGYAYAHIVAHYLTPSRQMALHAVLLLAVGLTLPVVIPPGWTPPVEGTPIPSLLLLLSTALGAPFFVVSATAPLLQKWFSRTSHPSAHDPYFLYAASNLGSIVALLAYPLVVEPWLPLTVQSSSWAVGFSSFALLTIVCAVLAARFRPRRAAVEEGVEASRPAPGAVTWIRRGHWVALAAVPSSLMLAVTTFLSTDVAAVPLLWTVPLALYLLTFVIAFSTRPLVSRRLALNAMAVLALPLIVVLILGVPGPAWLIMPLHLAGFFASSLVLHGELARTRPSTRHLTEFYLWMSVGGLAGGVFNTLIAPVVFVGVTEYPLAIVLACALRPRDSRDGARISVVDVGLAVAFGTVGAAALAAFTAEVSMAFASLGLGLAAALYTACAQRPLRLFAAVGAMVALSSLFVKGDGDLLHAERTFFGVIRVRENPETHRRTLLHGSTLHGEQSLDPALRHEPLSYYHRTGPIGQAIEALGARFERVAAIGLGAGSLAAYADQGQQWTFYELDPSIERIARAPEFFTYLQDCGSRCDVVLGDARLSLRSDASARYDAIIIDAFSSDAIPTHLLTRQAVTLYLQRLTQGGMLAIHISNRHLDLEPVLGALAGELGLEARIQRHRPESGTGASASNWVVMTRSLEAMGPLRVDERWQPLTGEGTRVWTDDYSDIVSLLIKPTF
jgi:spermidine synthase